MSWPGALLALLVSHLVGDFLFQTEPQALDKVGGLGESRARRALLAHLAWYMVAFIPALIWIGVRTSATRALLVAALVAIPHLVIDEGHFVGWWLRAVKRAPDAPVGVRIAVDQSFHVVCLLAAALVAAA
jgi:Protein of unknown function (DUF3307)